MKKLKADLSAKWEQALEKISVKESEAEEVLQQTEKAEEILSEAQERKEIEEEALDREKFNVKDMAGQLAEAQALNTKLKLQLENATLQKENAAKEVFSSLQALKSWQIFHKPNHFNLFSSCFQTPAGQHSVGLRKGP